MVERIACWSARHRIAVIVGWLVLAGTALAAGQLLGTQSQQQYDPGQAGQAEQMLHRLNVVSPAQETVLIQARGGSPGNTYAQDPQLRGAVADVVQALQRLPEAARNIRSPLGAGGQSLVSASGRTALVTFQVAGPHASADATVRADLAAVARVQAAHPRLIVAEAGDASTDQAANTLMAQDFHKAELTSVPITLILLLAVFGALIAAGIPVLLAGSAVVVAVSLLAVPSRLLPIGSSTSEVVLIIGMAVGVNYSLFYLRREREERAAGASFPEALATAAHTSGRAIVVSGLTVMVSLAGLLLTGIDLFTGIAVGTIMVVGVAVVGSLTFLPACCRCSGRGPTGAGSRSWAVTGPRPGRPGCGPRWCAGWCAGRCCGAGLPRWLCWPWPRPHSACAPVPRPSTCHPSSLWCRPWTRSSMPSPGTGPRPGGGDGRRRVRAADAGRGGGAPGQGLGSRGDPPAGYRPGRWAMAGGW